MLKSPAPGGLGGVSRAPSEELLDDELDTLLELLLEVGVELVLLELLLETGVELALLDGEYDFTTTQYPSPLFVEVKGCATSHKSFGNSGSKACN